MSATSRAMMELRQARPALTRSHDLTGSYDLSLNAGDCAVISCMNDLLSAAFVDLLIGLRPLTSGQAFCLGLEWDRLSAKRAEALRGRIGRYTNQGAWVGLFTMDTNILLQQMHHTTLPIAQLVQEAENFCHIFDLPGLPTLRPDLMLARDRRKAGLVRAFLARPPLVILENPLDEDTGLDADVVLQQVTEARLRGTGFLCLTQNPALWSRYRGRGVKFYQLYENGLEPIAGGE